MSEAPTPVPDARAPGARRLAGLICFVQSLALFGFSGFYLYELVLGEGQSPSLVLMSALLIALAAVFLGVMARAWWRALPWPRTPTILWNALLLPVAWSMRQADFWGAWPLVVVALLGIAAAVAAGRNGAGDADQPADPRPVS